MKTFFRLSLFIMFVSCTSEGSIPDRIKEKFNANHIKLNALVGELDNTKGIDSLFPEGIVTRKAAVFSPTLSRKLNSLGLKNISIQSNSCKRPSARVYIFRTNWISGDSIDIAYHICDTLETTKGFYKKDENSNEVFGLGNFWMAIKIVKYLNRDQ